jgi:hypothetical protein
MAVPLALGVNRAEDRNINPSLRLERGNVQMNPTSQIEMNPRANLAQQRELCATIEALLGEPAPATIEAHAKRLYELVRALDQRRAGGGTDPDGEPQTTASTHGVSVVVAIADSVDRAPIVFVDTDSRLDGPRGPRIRIRLNDEAIWAGVTRLTGIHWPADPDGFEPPDGWSWVERADVEAVYTSDEAAAEALIAAGFGTEHRYFDRATLDDRSSATDLTGCSLAINTPAPPEALT